MILLPVHVDRNRNRNRKVSGKNITDSDSKPWIPITLLVPCVSDLFFVSDEVVENPVQIPLVKPDLTKANPRLGVGLVSFSPDSRYMATRNGKGCFFEGTWVLLNK